MLPLDVGRSEGGSFDRPLIRVVPPPRPMKVEVRCYGDVREAVGEKSVVVSFDEGASEITVGTVLAALDASIDDREFPDDLVVMRDRMHVDRETTVTDGDVLSLTDPPMSEG